MRTPNRAEVLAGTAALLGSAAWAGRARAAQPFRFSTPSIQMFESPYLAAAEKGYFTDEGLDVTFTRANGGVAIPALISGSLDASASSASALPAILRGAALRIVLVQQNHAPYQLWSTRPEIRKPADLRGKQITIETRGDSVEIAARIAFRAAGINPDDVAYVPLGTSNLANGISANVAGFALSSADISLFKTNGMLARAHLVANYMKDVQMPINGLATSQKLVNGDPDTLRRLLRAIVKGSLYVRAYKAQTIVILLKNKPDSNATAQALDYDQYIGSLAPRLEVSNAVVQADLDIHATLYGIPKDKMPALDQVYDFAPLRQAEAELDAAHWRPTP